MALSKNVRARLERRKSYMDFDETRFRKAVYSLCKSMQSQGLAIPQSAQDYVDHCDKVKRDNPKPDKD
ncbi:MAG: hypothetical protein RIG26_15015 [Thalassospira sp.]|uniref:hypothetical protein n=1 Tax=Thalassospira sp. TaxID=1912094 RepID=UPI0032EC34CA